MSANGMLTDGELTKIADSPLDGGKGLRLSNTAARAWKEMVAAAAKDGVGLWPASGGAPCYRSVQTQRAMHSNPGAFGMNPSMTVNLAPVNESTHGWGTRIDIGSVPPLSDLGRFGEEGKLRRAWLIKNGPKYGWDRTDFVNDESDHNHFTHDGTTIRPAGGTVTPIEIEDDMPAREKVSAQVDTPVGPEFTTLKKNAQGDVSLVLGPARVSIVANITAHGLKGPQLVADSSVVAAEGATFSPASLVPADVVQVRFVRVAVTAGKPNETRSEGVALELVGNGASVYGQLAGEIDLAKNERLRIQAIAPGAKAPFDVTFTAAFRVQEL